MANDKPFECTEPGCGMSFANEDHLSVHQAKHAMSLALTSGSARPGSVLTFVADQTPTPTKFLRNCEEMGLFHELTKNPFEEAFKKAAEENKTLDLHEQSSSFQVASIDAESLHVEHVMGSLHTPLPVSLDSIVHSIVNLKSNLTPINLTGVSKSSTFNPLPGPDAEIGSTLGLTPITRLYTVLPMFAAGTTQMGSELIEVVSCSTADQNNIEILPGSVCDAAISESLTGSANDKPNENDNSPSVYYFRWCTTPEDEPMAMDKASENLNALEVSTGHSPVAADALCMLVSNASNGLINQATIVEGPVSQMIRDAPPSIPKVLSVQRSRTYSAATSSGIASTTKERLKAALQQNSQANLMHSNMKVMSDAVEWITANQSRSAATTSAPSHLSVLSDSPAYAVTTASSSRPSTVLLRISDHQIQFEDVDTSTPKKLRLSTSEDDPDIRRQRFLERNREAAARCRMKKKYWMTNMEKRSEEVEKVNHALQTEVTKLKQQVAQLKTMLLAHTDCPITQRQRLLLAGSHVLSATDEPEDDEAIAMAALSTLADSGVHLAEDQFSLVSPQPANVLTNSTVAVDLSSSNSVS